MQLWQKLYLKISDLSQTLDILQIEKTYQVWNFILSLCKFTIRRFVWSVKSEAGYRLIHILKNDVQVESANEVAQQSIQFYHARFKKNIHSKLFSNQHYQQHLKNIIWKLNDQIYQNNHWKQVFQMMTESQAQELWLGNNFNHFDITAQIIYSEYRRIGLNSPILIEIQHVLFYKLKYISLNNNKITNIQTIAGMNIPQLEQINLCANKISRISSSFNKTKFNQLNYLNLYGNVIHQLNLQRAKLAKIMTKLWLEWIHSKPIQNDISCFLGLQCKAINHLQLDGYKRIKQPNVSYMVLECYNFEENAKIKNSKIRNKQNEGNLIIAELNETQTKMSYQY